MKIDSRNSYNLKQRWIAFKKGYDDFVNNRTEYDVSYVTWQNRGNTLAIEGLTWDQTCIIFVEEWLRLKKINQDTYGCLAPWVKGKLRSGVRPVGNKI
jgi:hypothetical protein